MLYVEWWAIIRNDFVGLDVSHGIMWNDVAIFVKTADYFLLHVVLVQRLCSERCV